jgi:hypothetical protein
MNGAVPLLPIPRPSWRGQGELSHIFIVYSDGQTALIHKHLLPTTWTMFYTYCTKLLHVSSIYPGHLQGVTVLTFVKCVGCFQNTVHQDTSHLYNNATKKCTYFKHLTLLLHVRCIQKSVWFGFTPSYSVGLPDDGTLCTETRLNVKCDRMQISKEHVRALCWFGVVYRLLNMQRMQNIKLQGCKPCTAQLATRNSQLADYIYI